MGILFAAFPHAPSSSATTRRESAGREKRQDNSLCFTVFFERCPNPNETETRLGNTGTTAILGGKTLRKPSAVDLPDWGSLRGRFGVRFGPFGGRKGTPNRRGGASGRVRNLRRFSEAEKVTSGGRKKKSGKKETSDQKGRRSEGRILAPSGALVVS